MSKKALKGQVWQAINFLYQNFIQKRLFLFQTHSCVPLRSLRNLEVNMAVLILENNLFSDFRPEQCHFRVDFRPL